MPPAYRALHEAAAWIDLSARGRIYALGEDRARLLHAMTTNHVQQLTAGTGCYAFFLNAQGRILGDVNLFCLEDRILLDTEPETRQILYQHIDKYIIADDVTLEDVTASTFALGVEGPQSAVLLDGLGAPQPQAQWSHSAWEDLRVARVSSTGAPGFRIFGSSAEKAGLIARLEQAGAVEASAEDARVVRIEHFQPRYGEDITDRNLAQETQLTGALHFNKGCYLGQEIVERVRSRGHVNRMLTGLEIETAEAPVAGTKIMAGDQEAGQITSAAYSPERGKVVALGYVRILAAKDAALEVNGARAVKAAGTMTTQSQL